MSLFGKKTNAEMEDLIQTLHMDMENNYKDAAQMDFTRLSDEFEKLKNSGRLNQKQVQYYESVLSGLSESLKGYTHKDQPARWDPNLPGDHS